MGLASEAVIAKDVDSKRQLTEPLKSFIYVPEPEGRNGERERSRAESRALRLALKSSRLTSSLSSWTRAIDGLTLHSLSQAHPLPASTHPAVEVRSEAAGWQLHEN